MRRLRLGVPPEMTSLGHVVGHRPWPARTTWYCTAPGCTHPPPFARRTRRWLGGVHQPSTRRRVTRLAEGFSPGLELSKAVALHITGEPLRDLSVDVGAG